MKTLVLLPLIAASLFSSGLKPRVVISDAPAHLLTNIDKPAADSAFVMQAAAGGLAEVHLAELAVKSASSPAVKAFAEMMMKDHSVANTELAGMAKKKGIAIPEKLTGKGKEAHDALKDLKAGEFDTAYKQQMIKDHEETIMLFEGEASNGQDADLKRWAASKVPALKRHLEEAKSL